MEENEEDVILGTYVHAHEAVVKVHPHTYDGKVYYQIFEDTTLVGESTDRKAAIKEATKFLNDGFVRYAEFKNRHKE